MYLYKVFSISVSLMFLYHNPYHYLFSLYIFSSSPFSSFPSVPPSPLPSIYTFFFFSSHFHFLFLCLLPYGHRRQLFLLRVYLCVCVVLTCLSTLSRRLVCVFPFISWPTRIAHSLSLSDYSEFLHHWQHELQSFSFGGKYSEKIPPTRTWINHLIHTWFFGHFYRITMIKSSQHYVRLYNSFVFTFHCTVHSLENIKSETWESDAWGTEQSGFWLTKKIKI